MKKFFVTATLLASFAASVFAQEETSYRRTWDFTKGWSNETIEKLTGDAANWEPQTTGFQNNPTAMTANQTPWVMVNGEKEPIAELVGMTINSSLAKAKHCQICTTGSGLAGVPCFWLNGKGDAVSVKVPAGENVKFGYTAHGANDRGFSCNSGFADANGKTTFTNADNQEIHEVELINSNTESESTLTLTTVNGGSHIYYIIIGKGDDPTEELTKQASIAYIYDSSYNLENGYGKNGGLDNDPIYTYLVDACVVSVVDVNSDSIKAMTPAQVNDSLLKYDVVVLSEAVGSGNTYAKAMVEIINKVPMLNFKSYMYKNTAWNVGAGVNPSPKATSLVFNQELLESELVSALLDEIELEGNELQIFNNPEPSFGNLIQGYTTSAGSMFENDEVIATIGDGVKAVHAHGGKRNTYMLLPFSSDNLTFDDLTDDAMSLAVNAVKYLATTKTKVSPAATPTVAMNYLDGKTAVTLACSTKGSSIYYTTDGTEPTVSSTLYAEPFEITVDSTVVKAFAVAQGYDNSAVVSKVVDVKAMAPTPELAVVMGDGVTTITLKGDSTVNIYYSFNGVTNADGAALYGNKTPLELREPATITYFAASDKLLPSEIQTYDIVVAGIPAVKDTVAHFTANEADWFTNAVILDYKKDTLETPTANWAAKAAYYWGKSAWSCYSTTEVDSVVTLMDENGEVIKCVDGVTDSTKTYYKLDPQAVKYVASTSDTQWILRSQGQLFTGETSESASYIVGNGATGYYAESAFDLIGQPSKGKMTFGGKASGEPYNASIESTEKFQAPFDVVTYTTNGGGSAFTIVLQTSADGETWNNVDTLSVAGTQRYYVKDRMHVESAEPVYVRLVQVGGSTKAQLYDIYVITTDGVTGIEAIEANTNVNVDNRIFDLQGRRVNTMKVGELYIKNGKKMVVKF